VAIDSGWVGAEFDKQKEFPPDVALQIEVAPHVGNKIELRAIYV
jgi:hypothetical protein